MRAPPRALFDPHNPPPGEPCPSQVRQVNYGRFGCDQETGYSSYRLSKPIPDDYAKICASDECMTDFRRIKQAQGSECVVDRQFYLYADLLNPVDAACKSMAATRKPSPSPSPSSSKEQDDDETEPPSTTRRPTSTPKTAPASTSTLTPTRSQNNTGDSWGSLWATSSPTISSSPSTPIAITGSSDSSTNPALLIFVIAGGIMLAVVVGVALQRRNRSSHHSTKDAQFNVIYDDAYPQSSQAQYEVPSATTGATTPSQATSEHSNFNSANASSHLHQQQQIIISESDLSPQLVAMRIPIDKVVCENKLHEGARTALYRGMYKDQVVAIKRLVSHRQHDPKAINAFLAEATLLATLDHERIIPLVGIAWETPTKMDIVLKFMAGGDLRTMIAHWANPQGPNAPRTTGFDTDKLKIALHIAHALTYLHSLQPVVVHRDLKSRNVLLSEDLDAKLTDFGISREYDDDEDRTMTAGVGSSLWMAPEVMLGQRYTEKADVFSFGVLLSELDTMRLPYEDHMTGREMPEGAVVQLVSSGRLTVSFSYTCEPELAALGRDCVHLDPEFRPTAAEILHRVHRVWRSCAQLV